MAVVNKVVLFLQIIVLVCNGSVTDKKNRAVFMPQLCQIFAICSPNLKKFFALDLSYSQGIFKIIIVELNAF